MTLILQASSTPSDATALRTVTHGSYVPLLVLTLLPIMVVLDVVRRLAALALTVANPY